MKMYSILKTLLKPLVKVKWQLIYITKMMGVTGVVFISKKRIGMTTCFKLLVVHIVLFISIIIYAPYVYGAYAFREIGTQPLERIRRDIQYEITLAEHHYTTPMIRLRQVVLDWDLQHILVAMNGVPGELYFVRISQGDVSLVMQEHLYMTYGRSIFSIGVSLHQGRYYTISLYDYYNTQHSSLTWRQPFDFVGLPVIVPEFIYIQEDPRLYLDPDHDPNRNLVRTNDLMNNILFFTVILGVIIILTTLLFKRGRSYL